MTARHLIVHTRSHRRASLEQVAAATQYAVERGFHPESVVSIEYDYTFDGERIRVDEPAR